MLNDAEYRESTSYRWKVRCFLTAEEILFRFGAVKLPSSSRRALKKQLDLPPNSRNLLYRDAVNMIKSTKFHKLLRFQKRSATKCRICREDNGCGMSDCFKFVQNGTSSECAGCGHSEWEHNIPRSLEIGSDELKEMLLEKWEDPETAELPLVPVVVNKPKKMWIEWKKFISFKKDGQENLVVVSLAFDKGRWGIKCLDHDCARIFYQHRLISDFAPRGYQYSYNELVQTRTTKLNISNDFTKKSSS